MSATKAALTAQPARPLSDELAEAVTMRALCFGLLIAVPCWLVLALLLVAVF